MGFALIAACSAEVGAPGDRSASGDDVAVIEQALHEPSCWTDAIPNSFVTTQGIPTVLNSPRFLGQTSLGNSYNQTACPNQYIVEVNYTLQHRFVPLGTAAALAGAPSQEWCEGYWSHNKAKGFGSAGWQDIATWSTAGEWRCNAFECRCVEVLTGGWWPELQNYGHGFGKVRIVNQAGWVYWFAQARAGITLW